MRGHSLKVTKVMRRVGSGGLRFFGSLGRIPERSGVLSCEGRRGGYKMRPLELKPTIILSPYAALNAPLFHGITCVNGTSRQPYVTSTVLNAARPWKAAPVINSESWASTAYAGVLRVVPPREAWRRPTAPRRTTRRSLAAQSPPPRPDCCQFQETAGLSRL